MGILIPVDPSDIQPTNPQGPLKFIKGSIQLSKTENMGFLYKVGPKTKYKWGEITPISRMITSVTNYFRGYHPIYNDPLGAHLVTLHHKIDVHLHPRRV